MEKLEQTVENAPVGTKEGNKTSYAGLELIEERRYSSGTSIKYWM
ncbi:MAG TPA: hypothetical protein VJ208_00540 [Candidatus Nanoarchaeia archaeon]|nr:hypothetical protein [Candidatus Nanoarchaeia archaeon]